MSVFEGNKVTVSKENLIDSEVQNESDQEADPEDFEVSDSSLED